MRDGRNLVSSEVQSLGAAQGLVLPLSLEVLPLRLPDPAPSSYPHSGLDPLG